MKKLSKVKNSTKEELAEKKRSKKGAIIVMLIIAILAPTIWFGLELLATEYPITQTHITIDGKDRLLKFSEKTRGYRTRNSYGEREFGTAHHGYFLELIDSVANKPLHKLKFKAPVNNIQSSPQMYISSSGFIWMVSTTHSNRSDERGFILRFSIKNDSIKNDDYELDEIYGIHGMAGNKVFLTKGNEVYKPYDSFFGGIYLDLETEKIVDDRKDTK